MTTSASRLKSPYRRVAHSPIRRFARSFLSIASFHHGVRYLPVTRSDPLQQSLKRLSNRLLELGGWRDRDWNLIPDGEFRVRADAAWQPVRLGDPWPIQELPIEFRFSVVIPKIWVGSPVHCRFRLGGEALLFLNDQPLAGLNTFHEEHPILIEADGGETLRFSAQAVSHGLFGTPSARPCVDLAAVVVPERDVRSLYDDLASVLDAARYHYLRGRYSLVELLADLMHRAFVKISLPRNDTERYLARLAAISQSRSAESFYGNEESLASLWERWEFPVKPSPLTPEQLQGFREVREQFRKDLAEARSRFPAEGRIWLTGHAHIDLAWLWPLQETRRKARRTFYTVIGLIDRYSDFHFNQSSAQVYSWIEQDDPALFEKIRAQVKAGRWEPIGGMWVEPDGNLLSGESWVRQLLFGQRYFESRFGRRVNVAWLPDSFGFNGSLPQLLVSAGIPFFFTHKLSWSERNPFPYNLYWWEGIDGTRVLAHSFTNPETGYNARLTAPELGETWQNFLGKRIHGTTLLSFGYGDGGGGPSEEMLERYSRLRTCPGLPDLKMGLVADFYKEIPTVPTVDGVPGVPVWVGEQYLEYHRATFTTQAKVKLLHRQLEQALVEAETAAALAFVWDGRSYPTERLASRWQTLLLHQFHDILPGSSIHSVYEAAHKELTAALEETAKLREDSLRSSEPSDGPEYLVWNLQIRDRPLFAEVMAVGKGPSAFSMQGRPLLTQELANGGLLLADSDVNVPALSAVTLRSESAATSPPQDDQDQTSEPTKPRRTGARPSLTIASRQIENQDLRVTLKPDGALESMYDKTFQREVLADRGNQLWLFTDIPRQFDAWDIDGTYTDEGTELLALAEPEIVEQGPVRAALRVVRRYEEIEILQDYRLTASSRRFEIVTKVRWHGRRRLLRSIFPLAIHTHEVWSETAFGAVARPNHRNTPWDQARFEIPVHRWADLSEPGYGVSLLNNGKYGYSAHGNVLGISLLRGAIYPDPYADEGDHEFVYALFPHAGDWRNGTVREAEEMQSPLRITPTSGSSRPSLFRFTGPSLRLASLKKAEDSEAIILRLYEPHGGRGKTTIETAIPLQKAAIVNILEDETEELTLEGERRITFEFKPFQVISLKLTFEPRMDAKGRE
ncbi:MAG: alpha-mannosidase [Verrucomicrobia bacterium]|nr:alpha-mannosidase [Verrucomicrobiota bacterium]